MPPEDQPPENSAEPATFACPTCTYTRRACDVDFSGRQCLYCTLGNPLKRQLFVCAANTHVVPGLSFLGEELTRLSLTGDGTVHHTTCVDCSLDSTLSRIPWVVREGIWLSVVAAMEGQNKKVMFTYSSIGFRPRWTFATALGSSGFQKLSMTSSHPNGLSWNAMRHCGPRPGLSLNVCKN
jgi:hypothetical protein